VAGCGARRRAMIEEADLQAAVAAGIIGDDTKAKLLALARERGEARAAARTPAARTAPAPKFDAVHALYYAGALIVIGAMGLFSTTAFNALGGWALTTTAVLYAAGFAVLGRRLWSAPETRTPGGLAIAVAEMCIQGGVGAAVDAGRIPGWPLSPTEALFSESHGRFVVSAREGAKAEALLRREGIPYSLVGETGGDALRISVGGKTVASLEIDAIRDIWERPLARLMG